MPDKYGLAHRAKIVRCWCDQRATLAAGGDCHADPHKFRQPRCSSAQVTVTEVFGPPHQMTTGTTPAGQQLLMILPLQGRYAVRNGERELELRPDQCCLLQHSAGQLISYKETFRQIHFRFPAGELTRICPVWPDSPDSPQNTTRVIDCGDGVGAMLKESLQSLLEHGHGRSIDSQASRAIWRALQHLVVATLSPPPTSADEEPLIGSSGLRSQVDRMIESELRNPELSIGLISQKLGVSARHLHRLYAGKHQTLSRAIRDARLDRCFRDLVLQQHSEQTINEIALSWGFNDQAHFSRQFRQRFGITARDARAGVAPNPSVAGPASTAAP